jgi:hypothetical protein
MLVVKPRRAYSRVEHLKSAPLGKDLPFIAKIELAWKGLPKTKTLDYYEHL